MMNRKFYHIELTMAILLLISLSVSCRRQSVHDIVGQKKSGGKDQPTLQNNQKSTIPETQHPVHLVSPLRDAPKSTLKDIEGIEYHVEVDHIRNHSFPVVYIKDSGVKDEKKLAHLDFSQVAICTDSMNNADCDAQKESPAEFSGGRHSFLSYGGGIREIYARSCIRSDHSETGQGVCASWKTLAFPGRLRQAHQNDHVQTDQSINSLIQEKDKIGGLCARLLQAWDKHLKSGVSEESDNGILAKNALILGPDHCRQLISSGLFRDLNLFQSISQDVWKDKKKRENSGAETNEGGKDEEDEKVLGIIPENLFELAMFSMASLSILEVAGSKIGFVQRNVANFEAKFRSPVRATIVGLMLVEMGLSTVEIIDTLKGDDNPFPLVSTLVLSYTSLELMMTFKEWKEESASVVQEQVAKLSRGVNDLTEIRQSSRAMPDGALESFELDSLNKWHAERLRSPEFVPGKITAQESEKILKLPEADLLENSVKKADLLEGFSKGFAKASSTIGLVIAGLEIANILSSGGVDKQFSLTEINSSSQRPPAEITGIISEIKQLSRSLAKLEKSVMNDDH